MKRSSNSSGVRLKNGTTIAARTATLRSTSRSGPPARAITRRDLRFADLSGANLFNARLTHANLLEAVLVGANLDMALLYGADLRGANLADANPNNANLIRANLEAATLLQTNLSGANQSMARLTSVRPGSIAGVPGFLPAAWQLIDGYLLGPSANLAGADMRGIDLRGTSAGLVDLRDANLTLTDLTGPKQVVIPISIVQRYGHGGGFDPVAAGAVDVGWTSAGYPLHRLPNATAKANPVESRSCCGARARGTLGTPRSALTGQDNCQQSHFGAGAFPGSAANRSISAPGVGADWIMERLSALMSPSAIARSIQANSEV